MAAGAGGVTIYFRIRIYNLPIVTIYMPRVPWRAIEDYRHAICGMVIIAMQLIISPSS